MARTYFQDFEKDDGTAITVEYGVEGSYSETAYSPMHGADGGDAPEFSILESWPRSEEYEKLCAERNRLLMTSFGVRDPIFISMMDDGERERLGELDSAIEELGRTANLSDQERERMEVWIAENYVEEPDDDIDF